MAAVPIDEMPELIAKIDGCEAAPYSRNKLTRIYLQLLLPTFVRPGELRKAMWSQFDLDDGFWSIPAGVMKRRREHLVPLSRRKS
jgi:integrase